MFSITYPRPRAEICSNLFQKSAVSAGFRLFSN